jgi:osmotically-inducible protein OsmY
MLHHTLHSFPVAASLVLLLSSCTARTGKTAGQNVDDATITVSVKTKFATQKTASTLTRIGVSTDRGIIHLDGVVPNAEMKQQDADLAQQVASVRGVVNNLQIQ